jgi:hypothetical protein
VNEISKGEIIIKHKQYKKQTKEVPYQKQKDFNVISVTDCIEN